MDVFEVDKLFLFIAFVVPGFVTYKVYEMIQNSGKTDDFGTKIVDAVAYSCVNYALLSWLIYCVETSKLSTIHPVLYILFYVVVVLIFPVILAFIWRSLRNSGFLVKNSSHPTCLPWDFVFSQTSKKYHVIITMEDGEQIAGYYGEKSFVSSYPVQHQIFLEKEWLLNEDGGFDREKENSAGVLIVSENIIKISYYDA